MRMVAEGVKTASSVVALSDKMGVEMPICQEVFEASASASAVVMDDIVVICSVLLSGGCCRWW